VTGDLDPVVLIDQLRRRAADPERRMDVRPSQLTATVRTLDVGSLVSMLGGVAADLRGVVESNRAGRPNPAASARAEALAAEMTTPAPSVLPGPASAASIAAAEAALGLTLPSFLGRVYAEVADGGFGPGAGLMPLTSVVSAYRELQVPDSRLPRGRSWPAALLPVVDADGGFDCVDADTGRVVGWDPDGLSERANEARFRRSFHDIAPSVEAWLSAWVGSKTAAEQHAELVERAMGHDAQVRMAREARANIARKTPEERAAMGLPAVGWEKVVWGGLGWDEGEDASERPA
jgi:hypothetical protein